MSPAEDSKAAVMFLHMQDAAQKHDEEFLHEPANASVSQEKLEDVAGEKDVPDHLLICIDMCWFLYIQYCATALGSK